MSKSFVEHGVSFFPGRKGFTEAERSTYMMGSLLDDIRNLMDERDKALAHVESLKQAVGRLQAELNHEAPPETTKAEYSWMCKNQVLSNFNDTLFEENKECRETIRKLNINITNLSRRRTITLLEGDVASLVVAR